MAPVAVSLVRPAGRIDGPMLDGRSAPQTAAPARAGEGGGDPVKPVNASAAPGGPVYRSASVGIAGDGLRASEPRPISAARPEPMRIEGDEIALSDAAALSERDAASADTASAPDGTESPVGAAQQRGGPRPAPEIAPQTGDSRPEPTDTPVEPLPDEPRLGPPSDPVPGPAREEEEPGTSIAQAEAPGTGRFGEPIAPLTDREEGPTTAGIRIRRPGASAPGTLDAPALPGSGPVRPIVPSDGPGADADAAPSDGDAEIAGPGLGEGALARNALDVAVPEDRPLLALLLEDNGRLSPSDLRDLGLPLTVAVPFDAPEAAARAAAFRAAGVEVILAGVGLPEGATPRDVEVTLAGRLRLVPEAIGLVDRPEAGFGGDRALTAQVAQILAAEGYGLLLWDAGLNTGLSVAERAGAEAALVWRRVDGGRRTAPAQTGAGADPDSAAPRAPVRASAIERRLDRAAFEAANAGAVIVAAEARPEVLEALSNFAAGSRAGQVALVPVSAVLLGR